MFTVDFRFEENQTTIEFPCNEEFLSAKFDELGVEDKLKTSQYTEIHKTGCCYIRKC